MEKLMIKNVLNKLGFVRIALVASVGFPFIVASNAFAQAAPAPPAPAPGAAEVERVIVTGSLIPTAEEVGPNPVFALNRDLINKSGAGTTAEQLLQRQPIMNGANIPVQNNGTSQSGPVGSAAVALRGYDPGATLVLVDRRRVAPYPAVANSGYGYVDLQTIPITAVQSIDILKDGASTTYGADAVAGVVNFNLYKDYRGAQVTIQYGNTLDKDAAEYRGDLLFGVGTDTTSITGDIFYYKHHDMFNKDRGNSAVPPFLSSNAVPWNLQLSTAVVEEAGVVLPPSLATRNNIFGTPPDNANGFVPASDYIYSAGRARAPFSILPGFNFNAYSSSYPEQERWGGYAAFEHKICDDQLRLFGDFYYVDNKTHDELAPEATGNFFDPLAVSYFIPPNHPFELDANGQPITPPFTPTAANVGMSANAFNPFNPFQQIISGTSRARIFDFGNRLIDTENIAERFTVGVKGDKLFNGTWGYDGAFMYSQVETIFKFQGIDRFRFARILNANDAIFNSSSSQFIGQTIPYNPFVDTQNVVDPDNLPLIEFATLRTRDLSTSKLMTLDLNIYTTDLFDLPAGGVGLAFGGVFSRESYNVSPDDENRIEFAAETIHAGRKSWSIYAETLIPVFSPKWNIPGFYSLEFSAGVRYGEWLNNDSNAAVPKVGVRWQPFDESLTIRSTWGEGYLEPSLVQLYGPHRSLLAPAHFVGCAPVAAFGPCGSDTNPVQDVAEPETSVEQFPQKNLHPEHDRSWTGGVVYTPKFIPQKWGTLTLTVDFWDVERTGLVMYFSPSTVINGYNAGSFPGVVRPAHIPTTVPSVLFDPSGGYIGVGTPYLNGGRTRANGVDLGAQYQIETGYGIFSVLSRWSYLNEFVVNFPDSKPRQAAGSSSAEWYIGSFFGDVTNPQAWLKWRGDTTFDWTWHNWDLNWTVHFLDGYWEQLYAVQFDGFWKRHWVHPTWFNDAQLSYTLVFTPPVEAAPVPGYSKGGKEVVGKEKEAPPVAYAMPCWKTILNNSTLTVGVSNIFGEDPPKAFSYELGNSIGYPGSLYDNLGRFWYVRMIKKF
jgi:iron complex outermembrane receptor protein